MKLSRYLQIGIVVGGGLIILAVLSAFLGLTLKQNEMIRNYIELSAEAYFESIVQTRRWNADHGGVYVLKTEEMKSNPYLEYPDIIAVDGKVYTKKNPALMTREISDLAKQEGGYQYHITSLQFINPVNAPDPWENEALKAFERGVKEVAQITQLDGQQIYRLMRPLLYEEGCIPCHAKQGYQLGDVRGGISVSLPYAEIEAAVRVNQERMFLLAGGIFVVIITCYLAVWQLMKKLSSTVELLDMEKSKLEKTKAALLEERNKLEEIVSGVDADLLLLDREMKILWVNRSSWERDQLVQQDILGSFCYESYCNAAALPDDCPAKRAFETRRAVRQEHPIILPDGTTRHYNFTCSPLKNSRGEVENVLELVQDITDKKEQENSLKEHMKALARVHKELLNVNEELREKNNELKRLNRLFVDREHRIKELKEQVKSHE